jgi:hypothetical protein
MTQTLIELYAPKPAWLLLTAEERQAFFARIGVGMNEILAFGIEPLAFGETTPSVLDGAGQRFFAVWRTPERTALDALVAGIAASGWHDYFETVNVAGQSVDLTTHLDQLAAV